MSLQLSSLRGLWWRLRWDCCCCGGGRSSCPMSVWLSFHCSGRSSRSGVRMLLFVVWGVQFWLRRQDQTTVSSIFLFFFFLFLKTLCEACGECGAGTTVDCGGSSYVCLFGICTRSSNGWIDYCFRAWCKYIRASGSCCRWHAAVWRWEGEVVQRGCLGCCDDLCFEKRGLHAAVVVARVELTRWRSSGCDVS